MIEGSKENIYFPWLLDYNEEMNESNIFAVKKKIHFQKFNFQ